MEKRTPTWVILLMVAAFALVVALAAEADVTIPINGPSTSPVAVEENPGWDSLRMGNRAGIVDGVLVVAVDDMPSDPYDRCLYLLGISARLGGIEYTPDVCESIKENR